MQMPESTKDGAPRSARVQGPREAPASREWPRIAAMCAGLLVLPIVGWIVFAPARAANHPVPRVARTTTDPTPKAAAPSQQDKPRPPERQVVKAPPPGSGLSGEVVGPDDKPVAGASVKCALGDREFEASADANGRFRLSQDAAGCAVVAQKTGFSPSAEAALREGVRLRLMESAGIAGVVVGDDGAPLTTYVLNVEAFEPAGGATLDAGVAPLRRRLNVDDADGAFTLDDVAEGRHVLVVSAKNHMVARTAPIDVRAGAVTKGVQIALKRGRIVTGTVVDATTKAPLFGALVFAETPPGGASKGAALSSPGIVKPSSGEFTVETCPETCTLYAMAGGYANGEVANVAVSADGKTRVEIALRHLSTP